MQRRDSALKLPTCSALSIAYTNTLQSLSLKKQITISKNLTDFMNKTQTFWARSARKTILNFNLRREAPKKLDPRHEVPPKNICPSPIVSCRIVSYRMGSHRIASHCIVSYRIVPYRIVSERIVLYRVVSYRIVSFRFVRVRLRAGARGCACVCLRMRWRVRLHLRVRLRVLFHFLHRSQGPSLIFPRDLASSFPGT